MEFLTFLAHFKATCPVQVNRKIFQVKNFVFLTTELKSALNFSLENISFFYIFADLSFQTFGREM